MAIRKISASELQPTDVLREETIRYMEGLSTAEFNALGVPEVWQTPMGLLISDGNNRTGVLVRKGHFEIVVNFKRGGDPTNENYIDMIERAKRLREKRIYTIYDCNKAFEGKA